MPYLARTSSLSHACVNIVKEDERWDRLIRDDNKAERLITTPKIRPTCSFIDVKTIIQSGNRLKRGAQVGVGRT